MRPDPLYAPGSAYHHKRRWTQPHTVRCLETAFDIFGQPESLLDVGCAEGALVQWAQRVGITAVGLDLAVPEHPSLLTADLRKPVTLGRTFQWVLCWEVAEHLPESAADTLCDTLVRHLAPGGRLIFTAARPGQRGPGHINCQKPAYWIAKLAERGALWAEGPTIDLSNAWLRCAPRVPWYGNNVHVFWWVA
jgi:2-polyprenyl-3-methyl-5-hydroxy-6-metoxy-1,4-benzoquinol methylase